MKIALDLRRIANPGIGRYMKCLVEAMLSLPTKHKYLLIIPPAVAPINGHSVKVQTVTSSARYYSLREQVNLPAILWKYNVDLFHSPHFLLPLVRPCPSVVTIHDVIYLACKEDLPSSVGRSYYRVMMSAAVRLARRIITVSEFSKQDIIRYLRADPAKIDVIYPGVGKNFRTVDNPATLEAVRHKYGIEGDYILYTGIYKPRKNHAGLLHAFQRFLTFGGDANLVIAGPLEEGAVQIRRLAGKLGISERVKLTGMVDDDDLRALYSGARVYACPSLYEGFGFTVLEAMACGVPVVSSTETCLPEVAGDAAIYANPLDPGAFGDALFRVYTDSALRAALVSTGWRNLKRFCWERASAQTLAVYQNAQQSAMQGAAT